MPPRVQSVVSVCEFVPYYRIETRETGGTSASIMIFYEQVVEGKRRAASPTGVGRCPPLTGPFLIGITDSAWPSRRLRLWS